MKQLKSEDRKIIKNTGIIGTATLLSRILGFVRDAAIAGFLGSGIYADAFFVAFRIPNLLRRLFADGSFSMAFVPIFLDYMEKGGKKDAFKMAGAALKFISMVLVIIVMAGVVFSPFIVKILAPGFSSSPEKFQITVLLTRIMMPYLFFVGVLSLCMGILNALGHFAAPALAPLLLNMAMIASIFLICPHLSCPVAGLAAGVLIGGVLQLCLQLPFLLKIAGGFWKRSGIFHRGLVSTGKLFFPVIAGSSVAQVNVLVGTLFASMLSQGSISYLYYADRLVQFPMAVFAISVSTAVLPALSRQAASGDVRALGETFGSAIRLIFFITLPSMTGLIVLRQPIVETLFQRGAFTAEASQQTAVALLFYATGLWAFSGMRILLSIFYAMKDAKNPFKMAVVSLLVNVGLCFLLKDSMAHGGVALAASLSSMVNFILLFLILYKKLKFMAYGNIVESLCRCMLMSAFMGAALYAALKIPVLSAVHSQSARAACLVLLIAFGLAVYTACAYLSGNVEFKMFLSAMSTEKEKA